jgi:hypothetical protein
MMKLRSYFRAVELLLIGIVITLLLPTVVQAQDDIYRPKNVLRLRQLRETRQVRKQEQARLSNQTILGVVKDAVTDEPMMDVRVVLVGTNIGAQTDYDGKFKFENVSENVYTIEASLISYQTVRLKDIKIKPNEPTKVTLLMQEEGAGSALQTVVIEERLDESSTAALMLKQRSSMLIADGISGEIVLKETPDFQMATAMRRLPGVSLIEDRFLSIRGLYERYNVVLFNNAPLPFSDFDRIGFDYNQLQSNLAAQMNIVKSATAENYSEFAGGMILIETPAIPAANTFRASLQLNYNDRITGKEMIGYPYGTQGWRPVALMPDYVPPQSFPSMSDLNAMPLDSPERFSAARKFNKHYEPNRYTAPIGYNINANYQRKGKWRGMPVGLSSYLSIFDNYRANFFKDGTVLETYDPATRRNPVGDSTLNKDVFFRQQNLTASVNGGIEFATGRISFKNLFILNTERSASAYRGYTNEPTTGYSPYFYKTLRLINTTIYSGQLEGEHFLGRSSTESRGENGVRFIWTAHLSTMNLAEPGYKGMNYLPGDSGRFVYDQTISDYNSSFIADQKMRMGGVNARFVIPLRGVIQALAPNGSAINNVFKDSKLTVGSFINLRSRVFRSRRMGLFPYAQDTAGNPILDIPESALNIEELKNIYRNEHIGVNKFTLLDLSTGSYNYDGRSTNIAPYVMYEHRFSANLKLNTGLRMEYFDYQIDTMKKAVPGMFKMVRRSQLDVLPSATLTFNPYKRHSFRVAASRTLTRPQERELVPLPFLDLYMGTLTLGNPNVLRTSVTNYDLRYDYYISGKEVLAASVFLKKFSNPIEQVNQQGLRDALSSFFQVYETRNQNTAQVGGVELESRLNLGERLNSTKLSAFTLYANLTLIQSQVNSLNIVKLLEGNNRRLQGQANYVFNTGLIYVDPYTQINLGIFYNQTGPRIAFVGAGPEVFGDVWELERHVLDMQIGRSIGKHFEVRITFTDMLNDPIRQVLIHDGRTKYDSKRDQPLNYFYRGFNSFFTITYRM